MDDKSWYALKHKKSPPVSGLTQLTQLIPAPDQHLPDVACLTGHGSLAGSVQLFFARPDMHGEAQGDFESVKSRENLPDSPEQDFVTARNVQCLNQEHV